MYRSNSIRYFFFIQAITYINEYAASLPESNATPEEVAAGLTRLSEVFGFSATLFSVAERMSISPETFLNNWTAKFFYDLVLYQAHRAHYEAEYQKLISAKIGK